MAPVDKQLVVFDFDWSMADQDTDRWIFEVLAPDLRRKMKTLKDEVQWTDLVAQSLREAHARGIKREQIENALRIMPFHPAMARGVDNLKKTGRTTFLCLSNSNSVFISTILEDKKLTHIFDEVITNPAEWKDELLSLRRRVDPAGTQHTCSVGCSPNMCKGEELDAFLARAGKEFDRVVYVGDGSNDFCPILHMREQDLVLCRSHRGLSSRIAKEGKAKGLKPTIQYWAGAWEVEEIFATL
ncbi:phosphatase phospho-type [Ephemerocybe angulata]|uniref:Phosphatase phospho-type n=1 Tax=Ephemerocybe angulata TaxID=980116 RepID=A0A8H6IEW7_9AGAR|nr:phosphatase phospho-type [Tulosesus angulatus]